MAKKRVEEVVEFDEILDGGDVNITPEEALADLNFNVADEYKPEPLIPKGIYSGAVTNVYYEPSHYCIVWDFCLANNGGVYMSDNETPVDGVHIFHRNWLPKPGDENERTKSGKNNKRQSKINMLQDFQNAMGLDMSTPTKIATALSEGHWIGVEVLLDIDINEYQGRFRNVVNHCKSI